jgi:pyruvate kinase
MAAHTPRRTKIVATIGPASGTAEGVRALVEAGMDAARLNLSHGSRDEHAERARLVRESESGLGRPLALIADLQGPKLRIGELPGPVTLTSGEDVVVVGKESTRDGELPVLPAVIGEVLQPGHEVLIDDGLVRLRVERVKRGRAECLVLTGGLVSSHKGVNVPGVPVPIPSLTRKDMDDLEFALALDVDYVALSFVRSAADVRDLKDLIHQAGSPAHVIAKIEKAEAVDALPAVLEESDAVMVARGDLGVEIGPELEPSLGYRHQLPEAEEQPTVGQAMSNGACDLAEVLQAAAILVPTFSGRTASAVARLRPRRPVLGLTHHEYAWRQMAIEWGVVPLRIPECADVEELWERSVTAAREAGIVEVGDRVVITAGTAVNIAGSTNVIKVETV